MSKSVKMQEENTSKKSQVGEKKKKSYVSEILGYNFGKSVEIYAVETNLCDLVTCIWHFVEMTCVQTYDFSIIIDINFK